MKSASRKSLAGQVALVTGAGSGIGAAAARLLAREGAKVGLLSRTARELKKMAREIEAEGGEALVLTADIGDAKQMQAAVRKLQRQWQRLDVVFANAGINGVWAPLETLTVEEWDETVRVNLRGTFLTIKTALPLLSKRGGAVVVTSSINGTRRFGNVGASAYATTKAGQVALVKMLAVELARHRIRVNVICPGRIDTKIEDNTDIRGTEALAPPVEYPEGEIPLTGQEAGTAEEVAQLVLFLASDASSHTTGTEVFVDGAQSLFQG